MIEKLSMLALILLAILALATNHLRRAVIYMALFSLVCAFVYLFYSAPDVAIAEAIIGCGIATVLFLVALRKAEHFSVFVLMPGEADPCEGAMCDKGKELIGLVCGALKAKKLHLDIRYSNAPLDFLLTEYQTDLIVHAQNDVITLYGLAQDYHFDEVEALIKKRDETAIRCIRLSDQTGDTVDGREEDA
jgi:uncharacterized MnhB-related membrane protein